MLPAPKIKLKIRIQPNLCEIKSEVMVIIHWHHLHSYTTVMTLEFPATIYMKSQNYGNLVNVIMMSEDILWLFLCFPNFIFPYIV